VSTNPRIVLDRREHSIDSNKDSLADLETVNLRIFNTIESDTGYYLCIVANSMKSFRVTYSFLNVLPNEVEVAKGIYFLFELKTSFFKSFLNY
jgi:hypothetical protein